MLADMLREGTRELHRRAESTGLIADLLEGRADLARYALYIRNLHAVYESLERALAARASDARWTLLAKPSLERSPAIAGDLDAICGGAWRAEIPLMSASISYRARIDESRGDAAGGRLAAHAYTRLLGDLNGGAILAHRLASMLGLGPEALNFYRFTLGEGLPAFRARYRRAFDGLGLDAAERRVTLDEARHAFELNIALSEQVQGVESRALGIRAALR